MSVKVFTISEETRKRCKIIDLDEKNAKRFVPISLESYHYLYNVKSISFSIFFHFGNQMIEFIRKEEFSKELLDQLWVAMQRQSNEIEVCILVSDRAKFEDFVDAVRKEKLNKLHDKVPELDRKSLDVYAQVSSASQLIVEGGIDAEVVGRVANAAKFMVSNILDSEAMIGTLSKMINCDPTLYDHSASVAMLAAVISTKNLKKPLPVKEAELVAQCGLYHDVGKTCVPSAILNKPGKFTPAEFEVMKTHTSEGHRVLRECIASGAPINEYVARVAYEHHEKFCGGGYPCGRKGRLEEDAENGIHLYSRIVSIADVYSALLMKRVYKEAYAPQDAILIMAKAAIDFDPDIFTPFLKSVVSSVNSLETKKGVKGRILFIDEGGVLTEKNEKAS